MLKSLLHWPRTLIHRYSLRQRRVEEFAVLTLGVVLLIKVAGGWQYPEWRILDQLFQLRGPDPVDDRVIVVTIDDQDINALGWPISDGELAKLLTLINQGEPRAIGLDIYRDLPIEPGTAELTEFFRRHDHIIGIEAVDQVPGPPVLLEKEQVGFNNVPVDQDRVVRRNFLFAFDAEGQPHTSFALKLALLYLQPEGITIQADRDPVRLGQGVFPMFRLQDGPYARPIAPGYQTLANFRGAEAITSVSILEVVEGRVSPAIFRDRVVLIGYTAVSLKDFFRTPLSNQRQAADPLGVNQPMVAGVQLQADVVSQYLAAALEGRPLLRLWPTPVVLLWVAGWIYVGALSGWYVRRLSYFGLVLVGMGVIIGGTGAIAFIGWSTWLPIAVPTCGAIAAAGITALNRIQQAEKLRKSTEFLSSVINTIPDPIFVKDRDHRWIALNQAYCNFAGYPFEQLFGRTAVDIFPTEEAETFLAADRQVFESGQSREDEEYFTDAKGHTYHIATKRSRHQDAAGNQFLVGVIRDITNRKRLENELRRTALELRQANTELQQAQGKLTQLAYHDALTGLPNRERFRELFSQTQAWADQGDRHIGLLFLDLDGFKQVNDTYGHDIGDLLLQAVAGRLTGCLRGSDVVSRLGGDEFVILLPGIPSSEDAGRVATKVLAKLSQPFGLAQCTVMVTASIGMSFYPQQGQDLDQLMKVADANMYAAKNVGKNQFYLDLTFAATDAAPSPSAESE